MKLNITLLVFLVILSIISVSGQGENKCYDGQRNGIYYTDCWADDVDDTWRLNEAIKTAFGRLIFNERQYEISGPLEIKSSYGKKTIGKSGLIIEGITSTTHFSTQIKLTVSDKSVFQIGPGVSNITIKDIAMLVDPAINRLKTYGIEAVAPPGGPTSVHIQFSNVKFLGFDKGIFVHTSDYIPPSPGNPGTIGSGEWQFDGIRLDHAAFENCTTGIELLVFNTGWYMTNLNFSSGPGQAGVLIRRSGYVSMNFLIGNGTKQEGTGTGSPYDQFPNPPVELAGKFIEIDGDTGPVAINNSTAEGFQKVLIIKVPAGFKSKPYQLTNNAFGEDVEFTNANVVSSSNFYANAWGVADPRIKGNSDVFSIGDRFCWPIPSTLPQAIIDRQSGYCTNSKFVIEGAEASLYSVGNSDDTSGNTGKAMQQIMHPTPNKVLLELGNYNSGNVPLTYTLKRDSSGWLSFQGGTNISDPWKGYKFDGPVRLPSYNLGSFPPLGVAELGSMFYCPNCAAGSTPCSSGAGALVVLVNYQWICK